MAYGLPLQPMPKRMSFLLLVSCFVSVLEPCHADLVRMKDGDLIKGDILRQDKDHLVIRVGMSEVILKKNNIQQVQYQIKEENDQETTIHLKNGLTLKGRIIGLNREGITVNNHAGSKFIPISMITRVDGWRFFRFPEERPDFLAPVWRSLLLPGWGQLYNDKRAKGIIIVGGMAGLAGSTVYAYTRLQDAKSKLEYPTVSRYNQYKKWRKSYNTLLVVTLSGWGLNILDAALFHKTNRKQQPSPLSLGYDPGLDAFCLQTVLRF